MFSRQIIIIFVMTFTKTVIIRIIATLPIVGNEDLIDKLRHETATGNLKSINTLASTSWLVSEIKRRGGRAYWNVSNTKGIRNNTRPRGLDILAQSRKPDSKGGERGSYSLRGMETGTRGDADSRSGEIEESNNGSSNKVITPEQEALLRGLNFREYPTIQELSAANVSNNSETANIEVKYE